jgi:hypothetical protein
MKRIVCVVMLISALMFFGCAKPGPEDVAKDYVKKQFDPDFGVTLNTSGLTYEVLKKDENNVTVKVSGNIYYEENIKLVKTDGQWTLNTGEIKTEAAPVVPEVVH